MSDAEVGAAWRRSFLPGPEADPFLPKPASAPGRRTSGAAKKGAGSATLPICSVAPTFDLKVLCHSQEGGEILLANIHLAHVHEAQHRLQVHQLDTLRTK